MLSFSLPRFCDQSLDRSRKERFYPGAEPWIAKLDTVVHELYHIDPELAGIRRIEREDGTYSANCHGHAFFEQVAEHGAHLPRERTVAGRATISCATISTTLETRTAASSATSFRTFPSFPQRYIERLAEQLPCDADSDGVTIEPLRARAAADALHRGRSARPPVHEGHARGASFARASSELRSSQLQVQVSSLTTVQLMRRAPRNRGDQ